MKFEEVRKAYNNNILSKNDFINKMYTIHEVLFDYAKYIGRTDISKIEIIDNEILMTTRTSHIKLLVAPLDKRIIPIEILNFYEYESDVLLIMGKLISEGDVVFDIGGNIGWYSLCLSKLIPNLKINTFEPIPNTFEILKRNIEINKINNIKIYNHGFSNDNKDVVFNYYPEGSGNASMAKLTENETVQEVICKVMRIDDFVAQNKIKCDFFKIDVEGAELPLLKGAQVTIQRDKPIIFSEMLRKWSAKFDYHPNEIIELLKKLGYKCFSISNNHLKEFLFMDDNTVETNFFFLHSEKHRSEIKMLV